MAALDGKPNPGFELRADGLHRNLLPASGGPGRIRKRSRGSLGRPSDLPFYLPSGDEEHEVHPCII